MSDDSGDAEVVVQNLDRIADLDVLPLGEQVIYQSVVGALERASCQIMKWADRLS